MNSDIGIIGLGLMGKSLAFNMASKGFKLSLYNRPEPEIAENIAINFIAENEVLSSANGFEELEPFIDSLKTPKIILLMIKAGDAVDQVIENILDKLNKGDVILDGGNSHYLDTRRRFNNLKEKGVHFVGTGISGGEEGALKGPSIMPGGSFDGFKKAEPILHAIAAKDKHGKACIHFMGPAGAGHFVKTVHNGIEYAEMQLIAETYLLLRKGKGYNPSKIADVFENWLHNGHHSYLLQITINILRKRDRNSWILDSLLDIATDKGTGNWTIQTASEYGVPVPTITAALSARHKSSLIKERQAAHKLYKTVPLHIEIDEQALANAYMAGRIINHHQGFHLIHEASKRNGWDINLPKVAQTWTGGCIIQSELMEDISILLNENNQLLIVPTFVELVNNLLPDLTEVVSKSATARLAIPCFSSSLNYLYTYTELDSAANLVQAQRDYFGAHQVQSIHDPEGKPFHINWQETKD